LQVLILKRMAGLSGITEKRDAALGKWLVASDEWRESAQGV